MTVSSETQDLGIIDLDALVKKVATVKVFGKHHDVLSANGRVAELMQSVANAKEGGRVNGLTFLDVFREVVGDCIPSLTSEERLKLNVDQLSAIVALATRQMDKVKEIIAEFEKNGDGPEGHGKSPAPKSSTALASPSSGSRKK